MPDTTALLQAFRENNFEQAKLLLENDRNLASGLEEFHRDQIFTKVINEKAFDIIPVLIDQKIIETDIYEYDSFKKSIFKNIVMYLKDDEMSVRFLDDLLAKLDNIKDEVADQTLLSYAMEEGADLWIIKKLIDAGLDVHYKNNSDLSLLHEAVRNNRIKGEKSLAYVNLLIEEGLDVNAMNVVDETPLIYAIDYNKQDLIEILLQNGADPNHRDKSGESAFFKAVVHKGDFKLYQKLREYASPEFDEPNKDGVTLLFDFIRRIHRIDQDTITFLKELIGDGADVQQPAIWYGNGKTPLEEAVEKKFEVLLAIIDLDIIDINATDEDGNTLLHKVCAFNVNYDKEVAKDTYRKAKLLIEKGVDVNLINSKEQTALMLASDDNLKSKTVELLLTHQNA